MKCAKWSGATNHRMECRIAGAALFTALCFYALAAEAETRKEFHYTVGSNATVTLMNQRGAVYVRPASGRQVSIAAVLQSDKVEIDSRQTGNRIETRTHVLRQTQGDEARVDYEIAVPTDASVTIDCNDGRIRVENLNGNINIESDAAEVTVRGIRNGTVQIQAVNGSVTLTDVKQSRVQITSIGGDVQLTGVTGPKVTAKSTTGAIRYTGDFSGGGSYTLTNHSGDIDVALPANASVDLTARSIKGALENYFPFHKNEHPTFPVAEGRAFAGTSNSGASAVELRSFSGRIRVNKQ